MEPQGITGRILRNVSMKRYTSMKVGGAVPYLFYPEDEAALSAAIAWLNGAGQPYRFLGNGTNVIVADRGFAGGLIRVSRMRHLRFTMTETGALVTAGAGLPLKSAHQELRGAGAHGSGKALRHSRDRGRRAQDERGQLRHRHLRLPDLAPVHG